MADRAEPTGTERPRETKTTTTNPDSRRVEGDANRDPITGSPGSHPVGTGVGAAGGGAAGAVVGGAVAGPVGAVLGGAIGAIAGGAAGHGVAERVDPTVEDAYWRDRHRTREYTSDRYDYERDYRPAYRHGWESRGRHADRAWDEDLARDLGTEWNEVRGESRLDWEDARPATRDAWHRTDRLATHYDLDDHYWRQRHAARGEGTGDYDYDRDYRPAYLYGTNAGYRFRDREWDDRLENELRSEWSEWKSDSRLGWEKAKEAVRDAWRWSKDRITLSDEQESHWRNAHQDTDYYDSTRTYEDYRPAYRYGTEARYQYGRRDWDDEVERDLEQGWRRTRGSSRMEWDDAKRAVRDAWDRAEERLSSDHHRTDGHGSTSGSTTRRLDSDRAGEPTRSPGAERTGR